MISITSIPLVCRVRMADSRPEPGPATRTSTCRRPQSFALLAAVIDACWALGDRNPILLIHDVGAGGLSNALPEAVAHSDRGGTIDLRRVPNDEPGMSPLEIWCNESQERYVLAIPAASMEVFAAFCAARSTFARAACSLAMSAGGAHLSISAQAK